MVFPSWALVDCVMSLDIDADSVPYLAMALFKVRVESVKTVQVASAKPVRHVGLSGGVRMAPHPEISLKGVLDAAIIDVFGHEIYRAIAACRMREMELDEGSAATECVSMTITSDPNEGAIINLALGLEEGTQIREKLYG
jgi:hypothetical protein